MAAAYAQDLSRYPTSVSGDQIVQNIIQVGQSDGIDPVSLDHDFYGISEEGRVFSMASFRAVETGPNTSTGTLELHIYNSAGVSVPILTIGEDGTTVNGSLNVKGGHTALETTSVVVEDKDIVLASGAKKPGHLDKGGIILGTPESGTKTFLYDYFGDKWDVNTSINIDSAASFTVGDDQTILNETGLSIGEVSLTSGSLSLSEAISLDLSGLKIGNISITPIGGFVIGSTDGSGVDAVVVDKSGMKIGEDISLAVESGLSLGSDVLLNKEGLTLKDADADLYLNGTGLSFGDVSLTSGNLTLSEDISLDLTGLEIGDISITPLGGFVIGGNDESDVDAVVVDKSGVKISDDISLAVESGLSLGSNVLLNQEGLTLKDGDSDLYLNGMGLSFGDVSLTSGNLTLSEDISLDLTGLKMGDISITPLDGVVIGGTDASDVDAVVVDKLGVKIGDDISLAVESGLSLGSDVLLNQEGLSLKHDDAALYLGETGWKIGYDSTSHHLVFEYYDPNSNSYVTKAEMKA